jgi:hypothetical protein
VNSPAVVYKDIRLPNYGSFHDGLFLVSMATMATNVYTKYALTKPASVHFFASMMMHQAIFDASHR